MYDYGSHQIDALLEALGAATSPVALDTETVGVNPKKQSPAAGNGSVYCMTLAWRDQAGGIKTAYLDGIPEGLRAWLASEAPKVGHDILRFDKHVIANCGFELGGVVACTRILARLVWPQKEVSCKLKDLFRTLLGWPESPDFLELFTRPTLVHVETGKEPFVSKRKVNGTPVSTLVGTEYSRVQWRTKTMIRLDEIELGGNWHRLLCEYAVKDAVGTLQVYESLWDKLRPEMHEFYRDIWHPGLLALWNMERNGIGFDALGSKRASNEAITQLTKLQMLLDRWARSADVDSVNWGSPAQVAKFLYDEIGFKVPKVCGNRTTIKRTPAGKRPTDFGAVNDLLKNARNPVNAAGLQVLVEWKDYTKAKQFVDRLPTFISTEGRLHSQFSPDTETGRLSSKKPALQQIPRAGSINIRKLFTALPGHSIIAADQSQLEIRVAAHWLMEQGDNSLAEALQSEDIHSMIAKQCFEELADVPVSAVKTAAPELRHAAKSILYGMFYGKTAAGIGLQLGVPTKEAERLLNLVKRGLGVQTYQDRVAELASKNGYIETLYGRRRPLPDATIDEHMYPAWKWRKFSAIRKAMNTPIQGTASELMTLAMIRCSNLPYTMVLQVHDELVFHVENGRVDQAKVDIKLVMESVNDKLLVPLVVDVNHGNTWGDCK